MRWHVALKLRKVTGRGYDFRYGYRGGQDTADMAASELARMIRQALRDDRVVVEGYISPRS